MKGVSGPVGPRIVAALCGLFLILSLAPGAFATAGPATPKALQTALDRELRKVGLRNGALVLDLSRGTDLYARRAEIRRTPASVEKLYTTSTVLRRLGASGRLHTDVYGDGTLDETTGVFTGDLYLKGFGDPTFGSETFATSAYGGGGTVEGLATTIAESLSVTRVTGNVFGDETYFDDKRGVSYSGFALNSDIGGSLSALAFNRGLADERGTAFAKLPADFAADRLVVALRKLGVSVGSGEVSETPPGLERLAEARSLPLSVISRVTNAPSDNYLAEMLLKGLGARFGTAGTTADGAKIVMSALRPWGIRATVQDGSGLSRANLTTPREVVRLLQRMRDNPAGKAFEDSLAVAGRTGTLASRMRGAARGRCRAKTGTLDGVSTLAGYCQSRGGATLAFAFLMERVSVSTARAVQDRMATLLATYRGRATAPPPVPTGPTGTTGPGEPVLPTGGVSPG